MVKRKRKKGRKKLRKIKMLNVRRNFKLIFRNVRVKLMKLLLV